MSDSNRLVRQETVLLALRKAWAIHPEYRLGQLLSNLLGPGRQDVFFVEDHRWEKLLDQVANER